MCVCMYIHTEAIEFQNMRQSNKLNNPGLHTTLACSKKHRASTNSNFMIQQQFVDAPQQLNV